MVRVSLQGENWIRHPLIVHPARTGAAATGVEVMVDRRSPERLVLRYLVLGEIDDLVIPAPAAPLRTDRLWETTCFEAFLAPPGRTLYREFNFSPSTQWAAYAFATYRDPIRAHAPMRTPPDIQLMARRAQYLELEVVLAVDPGPGPCRLGLSAVIEERGGRKSYWALAHPSPDPDFHHPDCFTLELPAAMRP